MRMNQDSSKSEMEAMCSLSASMNIRRAKGSSSVMAVSDSLKRFKLTSMSQVHKQEESEIQSTFRERRIKGSATSSGSMSF